MMAKPNRRTYPPRVRELLAGLIVAATVAAIMLWSIGGMVADHLLIRLAGAP